MMINYYVIPYITSIANSLIQILLDTLKILTGEFIHPNNYSYHNETLLNEKSNCNFSGFSKWTILKETTFL